MDFLLILLDHLCYCQRVGIDTYTKAPLAPQGSRTLIMSLEDSHSTVELVMPYSSYIIYYTKILRLFSIFLY